MNLFDYTITSLQIFIITFIFGVSLDNNFAKLQKKYKLTPLFSAISQLFVLIILSFYIYKFPFSQDYFDYRLRHLTFSSFLIGLQQNMLNNFKQVIFNE